MDALLGVVIVAKWSAVVGAVGTTLSLAAVAAYVLTLPETPKKLWLDAFADLARYWHGLWYFMVQGGTYKDCPVFKDDIRARVQTYSLTLIYSMWSEPHYRNGTFQVDMVKNLRNVAIPGTGLPLSYLSHVRALVWPFLFVAYPAIALVAGIWKGIVLSDGGEDDSGRTAPAFAEAAAKAFREQLLSPQDWFSFWRLNCRLATLHARVSGDEGYTLEDKLTFLERAEDMDVPVTPYLKFPAIICKHRNEEGGLGFQAFSSATHGGDWIIQEKMANSAFVSSLLPEDAPLSTLRIVTASKLGLAPLREQAGAREGVEGKGKGKGEGVSDNDKEVRALSCVFRAGREGAITDHESILFNTEIETGMVLKGTTNAHWYRLGADKVLNAQWLSQHNITNHPDTGRPISGTNIPRMAEIRKLVEDAHTKMCPGVPLVGWDVALTDSHGMVLLEGNFSCNFFRGTFDKAWYFEMVDEYFAALEAANSATGPKGPFRPPVDPRVAAASKRKAGGALKSLAAGKAKAVGGGARRRQHGGRAAQLRRGMVECNSQTTLCTHESSQAGEEASTAVDRASMGSD